MLTGCASDKSAPDDCVRALNAADSVHTDTARIINSFPKMMDKDPIGEVEYDQNKPLLDLHLAEYQEFSRKCRNA